MNEFQKKKNKKNEFLNNACENGKIEFVEREVIFNQENSYHKLTNLLIDSKKLKTQNFNPAFF